MSYLDETLNLYLKGIPGALRVSVHFIVQDQGPGVVSFVGASRIDKDHIPSRNIPGNREEPGHPLRYGSKETHQLIVGDLIVIPKVVIGSNKFTGHGLAGLATSALGDPDGWTDGNIIIGG